MLRQHLDTLLRIDAWIEALLKGLHEYLKFSGELVIVAQYKSRDTSDVLLGNLAHLCRPILPIEAFATLLHELSIDLFSDRAKLQFQLLGNLLVRKLLCVLIVVTVASLRMLPNAGLP